MRAPDFWYPKARGASLAADMLTPLGWLYGAAGRAKLAMTTPARCGVPVICVGNVTAGGTGKTPVALEIARRLRRFGVAPAFLTRGYGGRLTGPVRVDPSVHGAADVGDEPLLLARAAPTIVARRRPDGAALAVRQGAQAIIMDDGFQNPALHKTVSILVVDRAVGFGNGRLIPAGPLREPLAQGLARSDAVVLMGEGGPWPAGIAPVPERPVIEARLEPDPEALKALGPGRWVAFAGIGRPEKFFATARAAGLALAATRAFPDHHVFTDEEIAALTADAARLDARLITTEKDAVRVPAAMRARVRTLPVIARFDPGAALDAVLRKALDPAREARGTSAAHRVR